MLGVYGRSSRSSRHGDDRGARGRSISCIWAVDVDVRDVGPSLSIVVVWTVSIVEQLVLVANHDHRRRRRRS